MLDLQGSLEENVLTLLCTSDEHAPQLILELTPDLFSTKSYQRIARKTFEFIAQYNRAPGAHLRDIFEEDVRRGEEGLRLEQVLDNIFRLAPHLQTDYVLNQLNYFIQDRQLAIRLENAAVARERGNLDEAEQILSARPLNSKQSGGFFFSGPKQDINRILRRLDRRELEEDKFSSGVAELDKRGMCPARKEVFLIIGSKGLTKTWWLIQIGKENLLQGKRVLHITLEVSDDIVAQRYVQSFFAMADKAAEEESLRIPIFEKDQIGRLKRMDFDRLEAKLLNTETRDYAARRLLGLRTRPSLFIQEFPMSSLTIPKLRAFLDYLEQAYNYKPDILLLDHAKILSADINQLRLSHAVNMEQLRGICQDRNIACVSPWHAGRQAEGARHVTSKDIAEVYAVTGTVDCIAIIQRTAAERKHNLARILVDKARNGIDKYQVMIAQSIATGQFCLDSVYMSKAVEDEVVKHSGEDD